MPGSAALIARVVPDVSGIDKQFDYLVPDELRDQVRVGTLVRVPLHGRRVGGWVTEIVPVGDSQVGADKLKAVAKVTGHGPPAAVVELAAWAAHRWAGTFRAVLTAASPPGAVRTLPPSRRAQRPPARATPPGVEVDSELVAALSLPGAVVRVAPAASVLPVLLAAASIGPILVVVPSVERAGIAAQRLRRSGLSVALLPGEWAAAAGGVDVVVGARSAAWAPAADLAAIVVLDEHDEALQEERVPTWNARDVCLRRAERAGIPCLLVSPVPSLAALAELGPQVVVPARTTERSGWPMVEIVDLGERDPWVTSLVTTPVIRELRDTGRRIVCVHNTTGRARRLACRACRALAACESCGTPVSEPSVGLLRCGRCGAERPKVCQVCGAARLVNLRPGVSRLREELEAAAGRPVAEVTASTAGDDVAAALDDVFVGTEAVLHRVRRIDTVVFLDLDAELLAPRYRAGEQALALLARAARLVGGRGDGGRLIVQTFLPDHEVVDAVRHADPGRCVEALRAPRRALGFPPDGALAAVGGPGVEEFAALLRTEPGVDVRGPVDGRLLVRTETPDHLADVLGRTPRPAGSRLRVEVDPPRV